MSTRASTARSLWEHLEPLHAVVYFSPEPQAGLGEVGYRGYWMGYFAQRAAPLGAAGPEVVHALFYNFAAERVARALPDAWAIGAPSVALSVRADGSVAALRRLLGQLADDPSVAVAADLAWRAVASAPAAGRALFAANQTLPRSDDPLAALWQAATSLREHRGDGHIAALLVAGVSGRESHVLHALATGSPREVYLASRDLGDDEWAGHVAALRARGLVDAAGVITAAGRVVKDEVERRTDELAAAAYVDLSDAELDQLLAAIRPLARAVIRGGDLPLDSPMGLDLRRLLD